MSQYTFGDGHGAARRVHFLLARADVLSCSCFAADAVFCSPSFCI